VGKVFCGRARGRRFTRQEIKLIQQIVKEDFDKGRSAISREVCEALDWRQHNGWLKDRACRDVLRAMDAKGLVELPPPLVPSGSPGGNDRERKRRWNFEEFERLTFTEYRRPTLRMVRHTEHETLWNELVDRYHYLGYSVIVGKHLKHMAYFDDVPIACLGWGSPAWWVNARDEWIGWDQRRRRCNLHKIVNNVRFLILPWTNVKNLASTLLAMSEQAISMDWKDYYGIQPVLLETFVDEQLFDGTCYRAANWIFVGRTKGCSKTGNSWHDHQRRKLVFVRPLIKHFRKALTIKGGGDDGTIA
jgi:hypothetical protein